MKKLCVALMLFPILAFGQELECQGRITLFVDGEKLEGQFNSDNHAIAFAAFLQAMSPESIVLINWGNERNEPKSCSFSGYPVSPGPDPDPDPDPEPEPAPVMPVGFYQDLIRGPEGSPITGWCPDGTQDQAIAGVGTELCDEPLQFEITGGEIIHATPPLIPNANPGDLIILGAGDYTGTTNCGGRNVAFCGNGNSGVSILGQGAIVHNTIDCGTTSVTDLTFAGLEMDGARFSCSRQGIRFGLRLVNIYTHDSHSSSSGAFGEFSNTQNLKILGNHTQNTGVPGQNNAHSIYHGGRGQNVDVEIAYNRVEDHEGGRCIQIYGHSAGETMTGLHIHHNHTKNCNGNAAILISHTDGQSGTPDERSWIDSVRVDNNTCENNRIQFRGANLNGGDDWTADGNNCPLNSTMGGIDPVIVTNNNGDVTGNTR